MIAPAAAPPQASSARLPWLDALRGAAALAVVWHHFFAVSYHYAADSLLHTSLLGRVFAAIGRWGTLGVPVFFVLSGFCIGRTWLHARSPQDFASRRIRRIFPAYYASLVLVLLCAVTAKLISGVNDVAAFPPLSPAAVFATLSIFTSPASSVPGINWVYWSLGYEIAFYLILAVALFLPPRARLAAVAVLAITATTLAFFPTLSRRPGLLFFCDLWPLFSAGLALALIPRSISAAAVVGAAALAGFFPIAVNPLYPGFILATVLATALITVVDRGVVLPRIRFLERIGEFSYSLYLTHVPVMLLLGRWFLPESASPSLWFAGALTILVTQLAIGWVFYCAFERPLLPQRRSPVPPA